jgi:uncharacterized glyoxalase superfamily protein PhnB
MSQVKAIPDGYHAVTPFLNVKGASDALAFYKKAFGAEERYRHPAPDGSLTHAEFKIGDSIIMISDAMMNPVTKSSLHLYVNDANAAWKRATEAGAKVAMPISDMFWGDRYGVVEDPWGNRWAISQHIEDVTGPELERRAAEAMKKMPPTH